MNSAMIMTDVLLHIQPQLQPNEREELEQLIQDCEGVLSAHFNRKHEHLFMVEYNPLETSSEHLLRCVSERGIQASRIGL